MNVRLKRRARRDLKVVFCFTALMLFMFALRVQLNAQEQGDLFSVGTRQSMVLENGTPAMKFVSKDGSVAFVYLRKYGSEEAFVINVIDWDNFKLKTGWLYFTSSRIVFESDDSEKRNFDVSRTDAKLKIPKSGLKFFTIKVSGNEKRFLINFVPRLPAPWGKHQEPVFEIIKRFMANYDDTVMSFQQAAAKSFPKSDQSPSPNNASTSLTQAKDQEPTVVIEVSSEPLGAEIYIDGVFSGSTPSKLALRIGEHSLKVTRPGFKDWERRIFLDPSSSKMVNAILEKRSEP
jgi:hypothetical protein